MKRIKKRVTAFVCVLALILGSVLSSMAFGTDANAQKTEWVLFSGNKEFVIDAGGDLVVSVDNANVNLPDTVKKKNLSLMVSLTIPNADVLTSLQDGMVELAQDTFDEAEISWSLSKYALKIGENLVELPLLDAVDSGRSTDLDLTKTIHWFRIYSTTDSKGSVASLQEVKLVDTLTPGLLFGANKTADTYLQLTEPLESAPMSIEASVKMADGSGEGMEWVLRSGSDVNTTSGHTLAIGATTEEDVPGAGMAYSILDATGGAQVFTTDNAGLGIDASACDMSKLAVAFWVYANEAGGLTASGDNQMRISSSTDGLGANFLYYPLQELQVNQGWNYITLPLNTWKVVAGQPFDVSDIQRVGFTPFMLSAGSVRYLGDIKLVVLQEEDDEEDDDSQTENGVAWTLRSDEDTATTSGHTMSTGITTSDEGPGAGVKYTVLDATNGEITGFNTSNQNLKIDASKYDITELAVAFWVYSNTDGALGEGDHLRIGSNSDNVSSNALIYYYSQIPVKAGWNYIELPLDKWPTDIKGNFSVANINTFAFTAYKLPQGQIRYFTEFKLVALEPQTEWNLHTGTTFSGVSMPVGTYTTTENDAPGVGMNCFTLDASNATISGFEAMQTRLGINVGKQAKEDLVVAFWVYSNNAGTLGADWNTQLRIGSNTDNMSGNCLFYYLYEVPVSAGWNYIELPLKNFKTDIAGSFSINNINAWGITSHKVPQGTVRYFGDFKLLAKQPIPITKEVLRAGNDTNSSSGHTLTTGATVAGDRPGANKNYTIIDAQNAAINGFSTFNSGLGIDASASTMEELAVAFWVYSNKAGKLGSGDQFRIGSGPYLGSNALIYYYNDIQVKAGWNYIKLPLNTWKTDIEQQFTLENIDVFGFTTYNLDAGQIRYFGDIELINMSLVEDEVPPVQVMMTENVQSLSGNYMIFSNTSNTQEENPYALFVTPDGYPALLWGNVQFTLTQDIRTGEWVDVAAVMDEAGFVTFYIDGEIVARSDVPVDGLDAPQTLHSIGADGVGGQIMNGYIADVRVWEDVRTADEIKANLIEKEPGVSGNGLDADTEGLMGSWFLLGDIQDVLETLPDTSKNSNTAIYKGSRADDWIDYELPAEIGEDYWSVIFVPDIQNLIRTKEYNKTWEAIGQWIADNVEKENIQHVIGAGDSTWNATLDEYNRAMVGFNKFNNLVPTNIIIGNHDYKWGITERDSTRYQEFFGEDAISQTAAVATYQGYFADPAGKSTTENSYYRFSVNGIKWMILQLEYHPRVSVMEWAQEILETYSDDNVIVTTHAYIDGYGEYPLNTYMEYTQNDANVGGSIGDTSEAIWKEYLNEYTNIKMILCGHKHNGTGSVVERIETNVEGTEVPALMINAQDVDAGDGSTNIKEEAYYDYKPIGMLGILRFSADGQNVALQYYAPTSEKSFSPTDPFGNADSNNLLYTLNIEQCSHQNTTIKINEDAATGATNGYTGDTYCTDCETMIEEGKIIKKTGIKQNLGSLKQEGTELEEENQIQSDSEKGSPITGDLGNPILWMLILAGSAACVYGMKRKNRKEGK